MEALELSHRAGENVRWYCYLEKKNVTTKKLSQHLYF
jgi:hypothetical protein